MADVYKRQARSYVKTGFALAVVRCELYHGEQGATGDGSNACGAMMMMIIIKVLINVYFFVFFFFLFSFYYLRCYVHLLYLFFCTFPHFSHVLPCVAFTNYLTLSSYCVLSPPVALLPSAFNSKHTSSSLVLQIIAKSQPPTENLLQLSRFDAKSLNQIAWHNCWHHQSIPALTSLSLSSYIQLYCQDFARYFILRRPHQMPGPSQPW